MMLLKLFYLGVLIPSILTVLLFVAFLICWYKCGLRQRVARKYATKNGGSQRQKMTKTSHEMKNMNRALPSKDYWNKDRVPVVKPGRPQGNTDILYGFYGDSNANKSYKPGEYPLLNRESWRYMSQKSIQTFHEDLRRGKSTTTCIQHVRDNSGDSNYSDQSTTKLNESSSTLEEADSISTVSGYPDTVIDTANHTSDAIGYFNRNFHESDQSSSSSQKCCYSSSRRSSRENEIAVRLNHFRESSPVSYRSSFTKQDSGIDSSSVTIDLSPYQSNDDLTKVTSTTGQQMTDRRQHASDSSSDQYCQFVQTNQTKNKQRKKSSQRPSPSLNNDETCDVSQINSASDRHYLSIMPNLRAPIVNV